MFDDTSLIRMVIADLVEKHKWTYETALEKFYRSDTCSGLSDPETGMFTYSPREIIELLEEEHSLR